MTTHSEQIVRIPTRLLRPSAFQTRVEMKDDDIEMLMYDVLERGLLYPVIVRESGVLVAEDATAVAYEIIDGHQRVEVWNLLATTPDWDIGPSEEAAVAALRVDAGVPCRVMDMTDAEAFEATLSANENRFGVDPLDSLRVAERAMKTYPTLTQAKVAKAMGITQGTLSNRLRVLTLPNIALELIRNERMGWTAARELLALMGDCPHEVMIRGMLQEMQEDGLAMSITNIRGNIVGMAADYGWRPLDGVTSLGGRKCLIDHEAYIASYPQHVHRLPLPGRSGQFAATCAPLAWDRWHEERFAAVSAAHAGGLDKWDRRLGQAPEAYVNRAGEPVPDCDDRDPSEWSDEEWRAYQIDDSDIEELPEGHEDRPDVPAASVVATDDVDEVRMAWAKWVAKHPLAQHWGVSARSIADGLVGEHESQVLGKLLTYRRSLPANGHRISQDGNGRGMPLFFDDVNECREQCTKGLILINPSPDEWTRREPHLYCTNNGCYTSKLEWGLADYMEAEQVKADSRDASRRTYRDVARVALGLASEGFLLRLLQLLYDSSQTRAYNPLPVYPEQRHYARAYYYEESAIRLATALGIDADLIGERVQSAGEEDAVGEKNLVQLGEAAAALESPLDPLAAVSEILGYELERKERESER